MPKLKFYYQNKGGVYLAEHKTTMKKSTLYQIIAVALGIALIISVSINFLGSPVGTGSAIGANAAGNKVVAYINTNLIEPGGEQAKFVNATEENQVYKVVTSYKSQDIEVYVSKDGSLLFLSSLDMTKNLNLTTQTQTTEVPKTAKPTVQLFVMSFCPYGIQAEKAMKPVVDLFGSKVTIVPHFIVSVDGDTVASLHGDVEVQEDMRQACILQEYGNAKFWEYVYAFDNTCTSSTAATCWKTIAVQVSIDTTKIESCVATNGVSLMKTEADLAVSLGVSGSPTLIINGINYNGARTPDAFKTGICSGFTTEPAECSQTLNDTGSATSGSC